MPDDDITITEEDTPTVSAEEVLQYMEEHEGDHEETPAEEKNDQPSPGSEEPASSSPKEPEGNSTSYYFSADSSFTHNDLDDVDKDLFTDVDKNKVEITREDKTMYLKAVLNDVPVRLEIPLLGNRIFVACRALTTQEKVVVPIGCMAYCEKHASYPLTALGTLVQMARVAMQVTAVNGKPCPYIELQEPMKTLEKTIEEFVPSVLDKVKDMNSARYNYLIQALNVFEHKLARLSDAAFDQDFWDPAATD